MYVCHCCLSLSTVITHDLILTKHRNRFLQDLEDKRRDEEDERSRKKDDAKIKKMMKANLPQQILAVNAQNDPIPIRRR